MVAPWGHIRRAINNWNLAQAAAPQMYQNPLDPTAPPTPVANNDWISSLTQSQNQSLSPSAQIPMPTPMNYIPIQKLFMPEPPKMNQPPAPQPAPDQSGSIMSYQWPGINNTAERGNFTGGSMPFAGPPMP